VGITIGVMPNLQPRKVGIFGCDPAIAIGIECGEMGEPIGVTFLIPEQLPPMVDFAVAVLVPNQQRVVRTDPGGAFSESILIMVEHSL
jgi:hypothetical protein